MTKAIRYPEVLVRCALALALPALFAACGSGPRPTVVMVVFDSTRADHLSLYGYERLTDPQLVALAGEGHVFERAYSPATWWLPALVSILTGLDPAEHGCWVTPADALREGTSTPAVAPSTALLGERLSAAGYEAIAAVGGPYDVQRHGFLRGFQLARAPEGTSASPELAAGEVNAVVFRALERREGSAPLFLFVHYFDAHAPYAPPEGLDYPFPESREELRPIPSLKGTDPVDDELRARAVDQYDRELWNQDRALGELMTQLEGEGLLEDALVIVTADHGEMFGEQPGVFGSGGLPFEPLVRVPLVVVRRGGLQSEGTRVDVPVSLTAIPRTVLNALGLEDLPPSGGLPRTSLLRRFEYEHEKPPVYVEHRAGGTWLASLRESRYTYGAFLSSDGVVEDEIVFDLSVDPEEHQPNLGGLGSMRVREELGFGLHDLLEGWRPSPPDLGEVELSPGRLEVLRAIGELE